MKPIGSICAALLAAAAVVMTAGPAAAERNPLRIDVPSQPRLPDTTFPVLFKCADMEDCQKQAAETCEGFNYPNGKILFLELPAEPRPFPIYSVICFD